MIDPETNLDVELTANVNINYKLTAQTLTHQDIYGIEDQDQVNRQDQQDQYPAAIRGPLYNILSSNEQNSPDGSTNNNDHSLTIEESQEEEQCQVPDPEPEQEALKLSTIYDQNNDYASPLYNNLEVTDLVQEDRDTPIMESDQDRIQEEQPEDAPIQQQQLFNQNAIQIAQSDIDIELKERVYVRTQQKYFLNPLILDFNQQLHEDIIYDEETAIEKGEILANSQVEEEINNDISLSNIIQDVIDQMPQQQDFNQQIQNPEPNNIQQIEEIDAKIAEYQNTILLAQEQIKKLENKRAQLQSD